MARLRGWIFMFLLTLLWVVVLINPFMIAIWFNNPFWLLLYMGPSVVEVLIAAAITRFLLKRI